MVRRTLGKRSLSIGTSGLLVLMFLSISNGMFGQAPALSVPAVVRSNPEFYGAVGSGITVETTLSSPTVEMGKTATLALRISGMQNPNEVTRPPLDTVPALSSAFQVEAGTSDVGNRQVTFHYLLKPRSVGQVTIPRIRFRYFNPAAAEGKQLQTAYSEALMLTVLPSSKTTVKPKGREIPERFQKTVSNSPTFFVMHPLLWLVTIPLACVSIPLIVSFIRFAFPGVMAKSRSAAAKQALKQLNDARQSDDPASLVASALNGYLSVRPTLDHSKANDLLAKCDEARFSGNRTFPANLIHDAERLLAEWEAES